MLLSIICALHEGEWTLDEVRGTLQMLFDRQYILTEDVVVEVRYRTVTRTDSEGNNYDVEVPYNYYICYVTLENFNLSHLPVYLMGEETLSRYASTWRRWATVPTCSRPRPMLENTPASPRHMRSRRTTLPMKPLPPF